MGFILLVTLFGALCFADLTNHKYKDAEPVILWANKVGPFPNPQETYPFFSLPFCRHRELQHYHSEGLGETILGYDLIRTAIPIDFKKSVEATRLCRQTLTKDQAHRFEEAVVHEYWYQLFLDDLPIWGMVGEGSKGAAFVFTHSKFSIGYNRDRIVEVNLTSENPQPVGEGVALEFTYEIKWTESPILFSHRFERYLRDSFLESHVHWFSVVNSMIMVLLLGGMVALILLRTLRRDLQFYRDVEAAGTDDDDSGWKQVHSDVFRPPRFLSFLSALLGSGLQLVFLGASVIAIAFFGELHEERGLLLTFAAVLYALSSALSGMLSGSFYQQNGGKAWIRTALLTATLFPGVVAVVGLVLDLFATGYASQSSIPLTSLLLLFLLWGAVAFPLTLLGSMVGRHVGPFRAPPPCKVSQVPRPISPPKWYMERTGHMLLAGSLPFGSMFIEMYYLFSSFWHYQYYYVFGFLGIIMFNVLLVCVCMTILIVYLHLNREDHNWWWLAFAAPASTGIYVFLYSIYYFNHITMMHGFLQTLFFFGYMLLASVAVSLMLGSVGFVSAYWFVRLIFRNVKVD